MGIVNYLLVICFSFLLFWVGRERSRSIRYRILRLLLCALILLVAIIGSMAFVIVGLKDLVPDQERFWYYADAVVLAGALLGLVVGLRLSPRLIRDRHNL